MVPGSHSEKVALEGHVHELGVLDLLLGGKRRSREITHADSIHGWFSTRL